MADISATLASLSSTEGSNAPLGGTAVGTGLDDNLRMLGALLAGSRDGAGWFGLKLTSVSGTNTVVGAVAAQGSITMAPTAYATGQRYHFIPAATNTGATTLNVSTLGAKNVFFAGRACIGGELKINQPVAVEYDGTQFQVLGSFDLNTLTEDTTPDGAADFVQTYDASGSGFKKVKPNNLLRSGSTGASMVLLDTQTASNSAVLDFTVGIDSTYDAYEFSVEGIRPATDASVFQGRISLDGGSTYKAGAGDYSDMGIKIDTASVVAFGTTRTYMSLSGEVNTSNNVARGIHGTVRFYLPTNTAFTNKAFQYRLSFVDSSAGDREVQGSARYGAAATAINGVRFLFSSGNIAEGTIRLYGIRKT